MRRTPARTPRPPPPSAPPPPPPPPTGFRLTHMPRRVSGPSGRAAVGIPFRQRRRSAANSAAVWYRPSGAASVALRTMAARSFGTDGTTAPRVDRAGGRHQPVDRLPVARRERRQGGEQFVQHQPQTVHVGSLVRVPAELLRRHVLRGAAQGGLPVERVGRRGYGLGRLALTPDPTGQTEVDHPQLLPVAVEEQVGRLDVAVADAVRVGVLQVRRPPGRSGRPPRASRPAWKRTPG